MKKLLALLLLCTGSLYADSALIKAGGGGGTTLSGIPFLTTTISAATDSERIITAGNGILFNDAGVNAAFTLSYDPDFDYLFNGKLTIGEALLLTEWTDCEDDLSLDGQVKLCSNGTALRASVDGGAFFTISDSGAGGGDITAVTAGNGLSGGGTTGAVSLAIADTLAGNGLVMTGAGSGVMDIGSGNGITVQTNAIQVNQGYNFNWTGYHDRTAEAAPSIPTDNDTTRTYMDSTADRLFASVDKMPFMPYGFYAGPFAMRGGVKIGECYFGGNPQSVTAFSSCDGLITDAVTVLGATPGNANTATRVCIDNDSSAVSGEFGGWEQANLRTMNAAFDPIFSTVIVTGPTITTQRLIVGMATGSPQPKSIAFTTAGGTDNFNGALLVYQDGVNSGNWMTCQGNAADWTCVNTTIPVAANTTYEITIAVVGSTVYYKLDGLVMSSTNTPPSSSSNMGAITAWTNTGAVSHSNASCGYNVIQR